MPLRILVVDDRRDSSLVLKAILTRAGHDVATADDGATALLTARQFVPQAVISDIGLNGQLTGYDLARAVRNDQDLPVSHLIAVTGHDDEEHRRMAAEAGFGHYLVKPAPIDELLHILSGLNERPI